MIAWNYYPFHIVLDDVIKNNGLVMKIYRFALILLLIFISPLYAQGKILKVGVSVYNPPFVIQGANKQFFGFDIVLMEYLCNKLNYNCQFIALPFNELLTAVEENKVDLAISSLIITPQRAAKVNFSAPYLASKTRFLAPKKEAEEPFDLQKLKDKKIGISENVFIEQLKAMGVTDSQITLFNDDNALVQALSQDKIGLALIDNPTAIYWQKHSSGALVPLGQPMPFGFGIGIAINRNNTALLEAINMALLDYQNSDEFSSNYHKYLSHLSHI